MRTIKITNLTKQYGKHLVFDNVNLEIKENAVSYLMGKNGSGKTTFFKCLLGLEDYNGKIKYNKEAKINSSVFVVFDDCPFYGNLTGYQNIDLFGSKPSKECIDLLSSKYLPHEILKRKFKFYSYGERKKMALIIAEILKPDYLFMDEISNGLDFESVLALQQDIREMSEKTSIILTGHHFEFYEKIVDDVFAIRDNTIIKVPFDRENNDSLEKIYNESYTKPYTS